MCPLRTGSVLLYIPGVDIGTSPAKAQGGCLLNKSLDRQLSDGIGASLFIAEDAELSITSFPFGHRANKRF